VRNVFVKRNKQIWSIQVVAEVVIVIVRGFCRNRLGGTGRLFDAYFSFVERASISQPKRNKNELTLSRNIVESDIYSTDVFMVRTPYIPKNERSY